MSGHCFPQSSAFSTYEVKKSRFIACIKPISTQLDAETSLKNVREEYSDARHICWAYIQGFPNSPIKRCHDDGEPSGTAGKPILNVLEHHQCINTMAIVIRYFGGIKLGAGGLVRAYSTATQYVLNNAHLLPYIPTKPLQLQCNFADENLLRRQIAQFDGNILDVQYENDIVITIEIPADYLNNFIETLNHRIRVEIP